MVLCFAGLFLLQKMRKRADVGVWGVELILELFLYFPVAIVMGANLWYNNRTPSAVSTGLCRSQRTAERTFNKFVYYNRLRRLLYVQIYGIIWKMQFAGVTMEKYIEISGKINSREDFIKFMEIYVSTINISSVKECLESVSSRNSFYTKVFS